MSDSSPGHCAYSLLSAGGLLACILAVGTSLVAPGQTTAAEAQSAAAVELFTAPDGSSPPREVVARRDITFVLAQAVAAGGMEWYLVRTKGGSVGWIPGGATEATEGYKRAFKSLSSERSGNSTTPLPSRGGAPSAVIAVPIDTRGSLALVAVTFNGRLTANLAIDTGASQTMISRRIAERLALHSSGSGLFSGIGGTVAAAFARLDSISISGAEVSNVTVAVHDFSRVAPLDGLLGLDFLGKFNVTLDTKKQLLILARR